MPGTVEKLPGKPIILVTIEGHYDVESARAVYSKIAEIADTLEGPIFRITDVRKQETTFLEMMGVIKEASKGTAGTTFDPRISNVFVGRDNMAIMAREVYKNHAPDGKVMPMFLTMEEAMQYIDIELAKLNERQD